MCPTKSLQMRRDGANFLLESHRIAFPPPISYGVALIMAVQEVDVTRIPSPVALTTASATRRNVDYDCGGVVIRTAGLGEPVEPSLARIEQLSQCQPGYAVGPIAGDQKRRGLRRSQVEGLVQQALAHANELRQAVAKEVGIIAPRATLPECRQS